MVMKKIYSKGGTIIFWRGEGERGSAIFPRKNPAQKITAGNKIVQEEFWAKKN